MILISPKWPNLASRSAKLGLTMVQKIKDLFGIIFWAKKFWFWNFKHFWPHGLCAVLLSKNFPSDPNWFIFQNHKISQICLWNHFKTFGPLETKLRSRLESNITPMGLPKNNFCKAPYGVPHTKISAWKAKHFFLGDLCYDVFNKGSLNDFSQP